MNFDPQRADNSWFWTRSKCSWKPAYCLFTWTAPTVRRPAASLSGGRPSCSSLAEYVASWSVSVAHWRAVPSVSLSLQALQANGNNVCNWHLTSLRFRDRPVGLWISYQLLNIGSLRQLELPLICHLLLCYIQFLFSYSHLKHRFTYCIEWLKQQAVTASNSKWQ